MGVIPVGNKKYFTFDGETSKKYNTHITGAGVFNAPVRAVEMVNIPNRNGAFALDQGYFENVELTYEASIVADTPAEFAQAVSDLRNWLCSKKGYCRLEDDYNPNEYRMAVYKSGLEVEPFLARTGKFDIVFDCKPQRFLKSGETAVAVANNGTLTNPTLFEASPLLQIWGYGNININNNTIGINSEPIGTITVAPKSSLSGSDTYAIEFDDTYANAGDTIVLSNMIHMEARFGFAKKTKSLTLNYYGSYGVDGQEFYVNSRFMYFTNGFSGTSLPPFEYGTAQSYTAGVKYNFTFEDDSTDSYRNDYTLTYDGVKTITFTETFANGVSVSARRITTYPWELNSTQTTLGSPLYFDLDIGEAYKIVNNVPVSVNNGVSFPAKLPTLKPGSNTFTYSNTITQFKVTPNWWKV